MVPVLKTVLNYHNPSVVSRFCVENPAVSTDYAQQLFQDLLGWLWLSVYRNERALTTHMIAPLQQLDKMWHIFILHTKCYSDFCQSHFGYYLHHQVEPVGFEYEMSAEELSDYLSDCYDHLGQSWLMRNIQI